MRKDRGMCVVASNCMCLCLCCVVLWLLHGTGQVNKKEEKGEVMMSERVAMLSLYYRLTTVLKKKKKLVGDNNGGP